LKISGPLYLTGAFALAGSSVISARLLSGHLGTFTITAVSLAFALMALLPLCASKLKQTIKQMSRSDVVMLLLQAVFGIFLFRLLLLQGLSRTSTSEAGLLTGATPAITAVLAWVFLKERVSSGKLVGILCTVGGVLLIQGLATSRLSSEHLLGNLLVISAAASESTFNVISRVNAVNAENRSPLDPLVQTTLVSGVALVFCVVPMMFEQPLYRLSAIGLTEWLALVWYGVFVTALAFICWYAGIKRCAASTAAAFTGMMPFTSLLLSVLLLGERAGFEQWTGGALVVLGMVMIGLKPQKVVDIAA
jgi:drug/metabolite transporter (DMT)-like permease